jgi:hypothetical protein
MRIEADPSQECFARSLRAAQRDVITVWNPTFHPLFCGAKANLDVGFATVIGSD